AHYRKRASRTGRIRGKARHRRRLRGRVRDADARPGGPGRSARAATWSVRSWSDPGVTVPRQDNRQSRKLREPRRGQKPGARGARRRRFLAWTARAEGLRQLVVAFAKALEAHREADAFLGGLKDDEGSSLAGA